MVKNSPKYHLFNFSSIRRLSLLVALLACWSTSAVQAQTCIIRASIDSGCVPTTVNFNLNTGGKSVKSVDWTFGDGTFADDEKDPAHTYSKIGVFEPTVIVTFDDNTTCTTAYSNKIHIFDNPVASIKLEDAYTRCWEDRFIDFRDDSKPGVSNSPVDSYFWDLGNGDSFVVKNFKYYYENNRSYNVKLTVQDKNGCRNTTQKRIKVFVYPKLRVDFHKFARDSCPYTQVRFINRTDSTGWDVNSIEWDFGNGTSKKASKGDPDWSTTWDTATGFYTGRKVHRPQLIINNRIGCSDTLKRFRIQNVFFPFQATASPTEQCFHDGNTDNPVVKFNHPVVPAWERVNWIFGDPSSTSNSVTDRWEPTHAYSEPGSFSIRLSITVKACRKDTLYCDWIKIWGPVAKINRYPGEFNDFEIAHEFYPNSFPDNFNSCDSDPIKYVTLDTQMVKTPVHSYCNALKLDSTLEKDISSCYSPDRYSYTLQPTSTTGVLKRKITRTEKEWMVGMPIPTERPLFQVAQGKDLPGNLHDTVIFSPNCGPPHRVEFINNTIKYRGYEAVDNIAPGYPDSCVNPSFPWASDSLEYFWDFGEGVGDTSEASDPNELAKYSTERLPVHLYTTAGCYTVKMWAHDPETGCSSVDSVFISVERPDAGWDTVGFDTVDRMTFRKQIALKKEPYRRGMIIGGLECVGYRQTLNLTETLPSCIRERYWIVWDSAAQTKVEICNGKQIITHGWEPSKKIDNSTGFHTYSTPGWKTVGLIIEANDCFDTVWYHNYKYVFEAQASFYASLQHACVGDTVHTWLLDTTQQGIQRAWFEYGYKTVLDSDWTIFETDTLDYLRYEKNGSIREYTSTMANPDVNVIDDTTYNNLSQPSSFKFTKPGVYQVTSNVNHRFGCDDSRNVQIGVGHKANFRAEYRQVCVGDSFNFRDSIFYYQSFLEPPFNGLNPKRFWKDPIGARGGITPRFPEQIEWDFDSDGTIDAVGPNPRWSYAQPGVYSVTMYTSDSNDCGWTETVKPDFIRVVSVDAAFTVENDDTLRFCAPHTFVFEDQTFIETTSGKVKEEVGYWKWIWGDGDDIVKSRLDNGKVTHQYLHNGTFEVAMRVQLETYAVTNGDGCVDTFKRVVRVEGPEPKFELVGPEEGCQPFLTTVKDLSQKGISREWFLGHNGRTKFTYGDSLVSLTYPDAGTFCISLSLSDSVVDLKGDTLFCTDSYPFTNCAVEVTVFPKDSINLDYPDPLCLNEEGTFVFNKTDPGYDAFRVYFGLGDTVSTKNKELKNSYPDVTSYPIFYTGSGARCPDTVLADIDIIGVKSDFLLDSARLDTPAFWFQNLSKEGVTFDWNVNGETFSVDNSDDFRYEFQFPGEKEICLIAYNQRGCSDTLCKWLEIVTDIWIPNVVTPNLDGFNDRFKILIKGHTYYDLTIYNRWGEPVFRSDRFDYLWNGNVFNGDRPCPNSTYYFIFRYQLIGGDIEKVNGSVTLIR